jgi:hypothetical protein
MGRNAAQKLIASHLVEGTLATGTLVMLELEAMGLDRVRTELSAQYVDHNLIPEDHKEPRRSSVPLQRVPAIWRVKLTGTLPDWVSAKDVILEMLRRHGEDGGLGRIVDGLINWMRSRLA